MSIFNRGPLSHTDRPPLSHRPPLHRTHETTEHRAQLIHCGCEIKYKTPHFAYNLYQACARVGNAAAAEGREEGRSGGGEVVFDGVGLLGVEDVQGDRADEGPCFQRLRVRHAHGAEEESHVEDQHHLRSSCRSISACSVRHPEEGQHATP
eukprot:647351-Rhodomonas_salina.5